jgi:hypothetical protein
MLWMADAKVASREVGGAALDEVRCICELEAAVPVVVQVGRGGAPRRPEGVDVEESSLMSALFFRLRSTLVSTAAAFFAFSAFSPRRLRRLRFWDWFNLEVSPCDGDALDWSPRGRCCLFPFEESLRGSFRRGERERAEGERSEERARGARLARSGQAGPRSPAGGCWWRECRLCGSLGGASWRRV